MKITEIVTALKTAEPQAVAKIPEPRIVKLIALALRQIAKEIDAATEGKVAVGGFGRFVIKQVEAEKDGKKTMRKRIVFHRATGEAKAKKGAAKQAPAKP
jgi:hypothetical protein